MIKHFAPYRKQHMSRLMTKPTKWHVRLAKTQISPSLIRIFAVRSMGSSDPSFLHADSEDRLIWVFAGRTTTLLVLSWGGSYVVALNSPRNRIQRMKEINEPHQEKACLLVFDQVRLKPVCSATEARWRLEISDILLYYIIIDIILSRQRTRKVLIRLPGCTGWSAPLLFTYGLNRFSPDMSQILRYSIPK